MKNHHTIRIATRRDAAKLLEIYAPYVEKTAVTFEYEVPEVQEFEERIGHVLEKYPFLICEREGEIAGYAYAGVFKNRAAYRWAVETTVYVREDRKKMGIGRELYAALEKILSLATGGQFEYEIRPILCAADVRPASLGADAPCCLGRDSFMLSRPGTQDRADTAYLTHFIH